MLWKTCMITNECNRRSARVTIIDEVNALGRPVWWSTDFSDSKASAQTVSGIWFIIASAR